jgi:hypothetical protein
MKRETKLLYVISKKRSFWTITNDYQCHTSVCELIDNALNSILKTAEYPL